jgi:hypothetical protein
MEQNFMEGTLMLSCLATSLKVKLLQEVAEAVAEDLAEVGREVPQEGVGEVDQIVLVEVGPLPVMTLMVGTPTEVLQAVTHMTVTHHRPEILMTHMLVILTHGTHMLEIHTQEIPMLETLMPETRMHEILMLEIPMPGIRTHETLMLDCPRRPIRTLGLHLNIMNEEHQRQLGQHRVSLSDVNLTG